MFISHSSIIHQDYLTDLYSIRSSMHQPIYRIKMSAESCTCRISAWRLVHYKHACKTHWHCFWFHNCSSLSTCYVSYTSYGKWWALFWLRLHVYHIGIFTVESSLFVGDQCSWYPFPTNLHPHKCTHKHLFNNSLIYYNYPNQTADKITSPQNQGNFGYPWTVTPTNTKDSTVI